VTASRDQIDQRSCEPRVLRNWRFAAPRRWPPLGTCSRRNRSTRLPFSRWPTRCAGSYVSIMPVFTDGVAGHKPRSEKLHSRALCQDVPVAFQANLRTKNRADNHTFTLPTDTHFVPQRRFQAAASLAISQCPTSASGNS
jgi:hypothetical protein